ncbi:MAG: nucleotidyltransferase domain-containing protein [Nitrospirota bacterium]|nr:nucleotidyltransferase domain-containing protein [Nitrospirota bacterium]
MTLWPADYKSLHFWRFVCLDEHNRQPLMKKEKSEVKLHKVVEALQAYQPERVYVFGAWARGEEDELSDLDLVIIKQTPEPFFERLEKVAKLLPPGIGGVDILVYTPEEFAAMRRDGNAFVEMIEEEAKLIYVRQAEG